MRSNKEFLAAVYEKAEKGKARRTSKRRTLTTATSLLLVVCIITGTAVYFKNMMTPDAPAVDIGGINTDEGINTSDVIPPQNSEPSPETSDVTPPESGKPEPNSDVIKVATGSVTQNLLSGMKSEDPKLVYALEQLFLNSSDFAFELIRNTYKGENIFISPYSVITALALTANGADGETRSEIEDTIGLSVEEMNSLISSYAHRCSALNSANSFWMRNGSFLVKKSFLSNLDMYYNADVYAAPFDDGTLNDINSWVSESTDGMIPEMLSEIDPDTVAFIINTVLFEGKWKTPYKEENNVTRTFTSSDGTETEGDFMCGSSALVELDCATGIQKRYLSSDLSFVALLPNESFTVKDVIASLDSSELVDAMHKGLESAGTRYAVASIPKFKSETSLELTSTLASMGISSAFSPSADFSRITDTIPLYVSQIMHKTAFEIDEGGTRAAAATVVGIDRGTGKDDEKIELNFDRPFVYMIVNSYGFPLFIGVCDSIA